MATIYTTGPIKDNLELISPDGDRLDLAFSFVPSADMAKKIREMQISMAKASQNPSEDANTIVGQIVTDLFGMIFGTENTNKILEFYAGRYEYMALDLLPYIRDNVVPACNRFVKGAQQKAKARWRK